ncbi:MAG: ABC transporter permease [Armatimonadota bacterium]|nr:ABC transporter permease [Armatimonadota bacterium]MDR7485919.1 ABC transporter permease [Armatimonadota bacterium]MDR7533130.1 ABC transporter permease [Armatimonadota bacterium]MDR7536624.1 ABC transporter permease [Armatimonadota bacterium]
MRRLHLVGDGATALLLGAVAALAGVLLVLPTLVVVLASFTSAAYLSFPPEGFSLRWYARLAASPEILRAARTSLVVAALAMAGAAGLGVLTAFPLVRGRFRGRDVLLTFTLAPIMLPSIVLGIALLFFFGFLGVRLSLGTLVVSHMLITFPYVVRTSAAALVQVDPALEEAAANLGATRWQILRHVTLPLLGPGLAVGAGFAFIESFDNLALSIFVAGQRQETLPMRLFQLLVSDIDPVVAAVSTTMIAASFVVLFLVHRLAGVGQVMRMVGERRPRLS